MAGLGSTALDLHGSPGGTHLVLGGTELGGQDQNLDLVAHLTAPRLSVRAFPRITGQLAGRLLAPRLSFRAGVGLPARIAARIPAPVVSASGYRAENARFTAQIAPRVPPPRLHVGLVSNYFVHISARTISPRLVCATTTRLHLLSDTTSVLRSTWNRSGCQAGSVTQPARDGKPLSASASLPWAGGPLQTQGIDPTWRDAPSVATPAGRAHWRPGVPVDDSIPTAWRGAPRQTGGGPTAWRPADRCVRPVPMTWWGLPRQLTFTTDAWRPAGMALSALVARFGDGGPRRIGLIEHWRDARLLYYVWRPRTFPPPPRPWVHWGTTLCLHGEPGSTTLDIGWPPCPTGPLRIPTRRSYHVLHDFSVTRLSDGLPIAATTLRLSLDADAWGWSWSGSLAGAATLESVLPSDQGEPVTLVADLDGYVWHLLVEDWSEDQTHGARSINVSGRGLSAELADPFELPVSGILQQDRTLQQALIERLPFGSPWSLTFADGTPDWLLPAGAWSWTNSTPIATIHAACQAVGLVVIPAPAARTLTVQPRYPVLPWALDAAEPDVIVPESAILRRTRGRRVPTQGNVVWVQGGEAGGILARVYRTGSAADRAVEMRQCDLITHADGARLLGGRILAAQEQQPEVRSVLLPLGGDVPLIALGSILDIGDVRAIVSGVAIEVAEGRCSQTLTIGEDTANRWAAWKRLLPGSPLLSGQVSEAADGVARVGLRGTGTVRVRYSGAAPALGSWVWVQDGRVQGAAPTLEPLEIEV